MGLHPKFEIVVLGDDVSGWRWFWMTMILVQGQWFYVSVVMVKVVNGLGVRGCFWGNSY